MVPADDSWATSLRRTLVQQNKYGQREDAKWLLCQTLSERVKATKFICKKSCNIQNNVASYFSKD